MSRGLGVPVSGDSKEVSVSLGEGLYPLSRITYKNHESSSDQSLSHPITNKGIKNSK